MQLISIILLLLSVAMFVGAILFIARWHRTYGKVSVAHLLNEDIGHLGVSAVVSYPETETPLVALLEEEYPRSEAIIITDLERACTRLADMVERYNLVRVSHDHLVGVRNLYRSRRRAFRRVVVVDLPMEHSGEATTIGRKVALYDNLLYLQGESIIEPNALTYCANVVASQHSANTIELRSIVGADAHLESGDMADITNLKRLRSNRPLAWRKVSLLSVVMVVLLPLLMVPMVALSQSWLLLVTAEIVVAIMVLFLSVSAGVATKKSLTKRLITLFQNFYRFWRGECATRRASKTHDIAPSLARERVQSRPARYHEDARQGR